MVQIEGTGKDARKLKLIPQSTDPSLGLDDGSPNLSGKGGNPGNGRFEQGAILIGTAAGAVIILGLDGSGVDYVERKDGITIPFQLVDRTGGNPIPANPTRVSITGLDPDKKEFTLSESVKNVDYGGGMLTVAGVNFTVMEAKGKKVTVMEPPKLPFVLVDDDMVRAAFLQCPPEGEDAQGGTPFEFMQRSDDETRNLYAAAYVNHWCELKTR